jgi:uncharacterized membrane protein
MSEHVRSGRNLWAGLLVGLGLGGFVDGIVFHQLLQWHHLVCTTATCEPHSIEELKRQTFQDGLFHVACWLFTAGGVALLATAPRTPHSGWTVLAGSIAGWGLFNLIEGTINHLVLGIHHVRPGPTQGVWDIAFLIWGAAFVALGFMMRPRAGFQSS